MIRTVSRVTEAMFRQARQHIFSPDQTSANRTKRALYQSYGFPNVVGCIDGAPVRIQRPHEQNYGIFVTEKKEERTKKCLASSRLERTTRKLHEGFFLIIIIISFKGAIRDFLQSPHSAANCLQHARSSGPGATVCKSRVTHRALITCKCHVTCHLVRRDS